MSSLGFRPHLVGRCARCVVTIPTCRSQSLRLASTAAKPVKAAAKAATASVPKKKISTKSTAGATPAKTPRKKAEAAAPGTAETPAPAVKKTTRAASTKATASAKKADASAGVEAAKPAAAATTRVRKTTSAPAAAKAASATATASPRFKTTGASESTTNSAAQDATNTGSTPLPEIEDAIKQEVKGKVAPELQGANVDKSSPEYKQASRRYVSVMVALPILLVTSYFLFDRLALGHQPKKLADFVAPSTETEGSGKHSPA